MATEGPQILRSYTTTTDLSAKQYFFVKLSAARTVAVCASATDKPIGILQNKPTANQEAVVCVLGQTKVSAGAALATAGAWIGTDANGEAVNYTTSSTANYICGTQEEAAGAQHGYFTAMVNCINPMRAG